MITDLVHAMSLEDVPESWADYIEKTKNYERRGHLEEVKRAGFDVEMQAGKMMEFYETGVLA